MASQFTGTDKANLLSTALTEDSGDNIAITATSDAVATGGDGADKILLGKDVSGFTASGGTGADSVSVTASATSSDIQGNRGADTIRVTGELTSTSVKGGEDNDTIHISGGLRLHLFSVVQEMTRSPSTTMQKTFKNPDPRRTGLKRLQHHAQSFEDSTAKGGSGADLIDFASSSLHPKCKALAAMTLFVLLAMHPELPSRVAKARTPFF